MKKKILSVVIVAALVLTMAACGVNVTSTSTTTETHTDANGNTTTTTTTTTTENGKTETTTTVEESSAENAQTVADVTFQNDTDFDIAELYFTGANEDNWGVNIIEAADLGKLEADTHVTFEQAFKYTMDDVLWDMKVVDENGDYLQFEEIDISAAADPENITIIICNAEGDSYGYIVE